VELGTQFCDRGKERCLWFFLFFDFKPNPKIQGIEDDFWIENNRDKRYNVVLKIGFSRLAEFIENLKYIWFNIPILVG
jgi:hypothetical protein